MTVREPKLGSNRFQAATTLLARGLMAFLLLFYVSYIPFHLLTEQHLSDAFGSSTVVDISEHEFGAHGDDEADHDHNHDAHHTPHPASEHSIQILRKWDSPAVCLVFVPGVITMAVEPPAADIAISFPEPIERPGESPPDPRQTRAPPTI